jgi:dTDP-glucose pyrophosphorylase
MTSWRKHIIKLGSTIKQALVQLNELAADAILFVVDSEEKLIGSLTDGDVRRGFLRGLNFESKVEEFVQANPKYLVKGEFTLNQVISYRKGNYRILPVIDRKKSIVNILNFRFNKSYLPLDAVIMAGGRGERLRPLTDSIPKPLLKIGDKPIVEYNVDSLAAYGVHNIWVSIRYLGKQISEYFGDGSSKNLTIQYVDEFEALGTIGAVSLIENFEHDIILLLNSDILTNLDYEEFLLDFMESGADMSIATIPYSIKVPYAVLETTNNHVVSFREKPTYTYYSNGGIYLIKRSILKYIPKSSFFNATDLMEILLKLNLKVSSFPIVGYWLDIGNPEDFAKAQEDIKHIKM